MAIYRRKSSRKKINRRNLYRLLLAEMDGWYCYYCQRPLHNVMDLYNLVDEPDSCVRMVNYVTGFHDKCPTPECNCSKAYLSYNKESWFKVYPTLDHKIPKSKGGVNTIDNFVLSCGKCNNSKQDVVYEEFLK